MFVLETCRKISQQAKDRKSLRQNLISYIDDKVGEIMTVLKNTGLDENTIVIFTADHGEMMGERGMWFKQHFFEWAARVPFIVCAPERFAASRISQNTSLVDLMPTLVDLAAGRPFDDYVAPCDGTSLVPALNGDASGLSDIVISEFAADGSTGPSRMVKKGNWKLMWLEGKDTLLYNLATDPNELENLTGRSECAEIETELTNILFDGWNPEVLVPEIRASQRRRLAIHNITGGEPTYVNTVRLDDSTRYIRNAGAAETKAKARLPYVAPTCPDKSR